MADIKSAAKNNKFVNYVKSSIQELTKVTWPTKNQAVRLTAIVLGFTFVFAIFLTLVDYLANKGYLSLLEYAAK
ncbi:preprotein translocase subunit SecE [Candidatus Peregrinibacteria bacterium]|jgi:preprotein translocase SecE subunit|nr:preprotein translocase subunit SecE [Candidatus Peregrinibacteria bacterium]MBT4055503.1 preprotein translocase subunit SecE [Candidatus Peregrinibacteria bacterium]